MESSADYLVGSGDPLADDDPYFDYDPLCEADGNYEEAEVIASLI